MKTLSDGTFSVLIRYGTKHRCRVRIDTRDPDEAERRLAAVKKFGKEIAVAKLTNKNAGATLLELAGRGHFDDARIGLKTFQAAGTKAELGEKKGPGPIVTMNDLAEAWTSNRIAHDYPDHVRAKRSAPRDVERWNHLNKTIGRIPVKRFVLEDAELAMRALPKGITSSTRRQYAQVMCRMLRLAAYPLRLIPATPLPHGFLPKANPPKARAWLYPAEDAILLASERVPLLHRIFYGVLAREGMRCSEATTLQWRDLDLRVGVIKLDKNKTDDPRAWALSPDVVATLKRIKGDAEPDDYPFRDVQDPAMAAKLRTHLKRAKIDRAELFEQSATRKRVCVHDLRGTFVTISLANGKTETWVADRTGHRSSDQINLYRRAARTATELGLGTLAALDKAIAWGDREAKRGSAQAPAKPVTAKPVTAKPVTAKPTPAKPRRRTA